MVSGSIGILEIRRQENKVLLVYLFHSVCLQCGSVVLLRVTRHIVFNLTKLTDICVGFFDRFFKGTHTRSLPAPPGVKFKN